MQSRSIRPSPARRWALAVGTAAVLVSGVVVAAFASGEPEAATEPAPEAAAGVLVQAQVDRGLEAFRGRGCAECHGGSFEGAFGPPIDIGSFRTKWQGETVDSMVSYIYNNMPPGGARSVPRDVILDIVTAIMAVHDVPVGAETELTLDTLEGVVFDFPEN